MKRKVLSVVLTLCMVFSLVPSSVFAQTPTTVDKTAVTKTVEETVTEDITTEDIVTEQPSTQENTEQEAVEQPVEQQTQPVVQTQTVEKTVTEQTPEQTAQPVEAAEPAVEETVTAEQETVSDTATMAMVTRTYSGNITVWYGTSYGASQAPETITLGLYEYGRNTPVHTIEVEVKSKLDTNANYTTLSYSFSDVRVDNQENYYVAIVGNVNNFEADYGYGNGSNRFYGKRITLTYTGASFDEGDHEFTHIDVRIQGATLEVTYVNKSIIKNIVNGVEQDVVVSTTTDTLEATVTNVDYVSINGTQYTGFRKRQNQGKEEFMANASVTLTSLNESSVAEIKVDLVDENNTPINDVIITYGYDGILAAIYDCDGYSYRNGEHHYDGIDFDINNIANYTIELTKYVLPVEKVWDDADNQDGKRPESVTIQLYRSGSPVRGKTLTLNAANGWYDVFTDITLASGESSDVYTVRETPVPAGYTHNPELGKDVAIDLAAGKYVVTNHYTPEMTSATVTKVWDDADNRDGVRPENLTVTLSDGQTAVLNAENNWTATIGNLPKYAAGEEIVYTWTEAAVEDYELTSTEKAGTVTTLTNSYTPATTEVSVTKVWNDADNQDGKRPASITVVLLADGEEQSSAILNAENGWTYTWTQLAEKAAGAVINYTVSEIAVDGYETAITGSAADGYTITNTHEPETTTVSGEKIWVDNDNQDGVRPESITINLLADGEVVETAAVTAEDGWAWSFTELPKYSAGREIVYSITEDAVEGYTATVDGYNVTNTHQAEYIDIDVTKVWNDVDNQAGFRPESVTIMLKADDSEVDSLTLSTANGWAGKFENLPKYKNGKAIVYTLAEEEVANYTSAITGSVEEGFTVTNTHEPEYIDIDVTKVWDDNDNQDGVRPETVTIILKAGDSKVDSVELSEENNWTGKFENLPKHKNGEEIVYTVTEKAILGEDGTSIYTPDYEQNEETGLWTVTNSYTPQTTYVEVHKVWDDGDNRDNIRPENVKIQLYADGEAVADAVKTLDQTNSWRTVFDELPKYRDGGVEIVYTVEEVEVAAGYEADCVKDEETGVWTVINTHEEATKELTVAKVWDDADNKDGLRPETVKVQLYANGDICGDAVVLSNENGWKHTWTVYVNENGDEIVYTIAEVEVPEGYTSTVEASVKGFIVTNKHVPAEVSTTIPTPEPPQIPDTGDTSSTMLWFVLMLASALGLFGTVIFRKKEEQE